MSIKYDKLLRIFEQRHITSTQIREMNLMGQQTWRNIKDGKGINTVTISKICELLKMQPGDLIEWVDDGKHNE